MVVIAGATPTVYDGSFAITSTGSNTFTYTLPSTPSASASGSGMSATNGTLYTQPITISTTTVLQATMVVGGIAAPYQAETYVFPAAVATQPAAPAGFPTVWNGTINNESVSADYAMSSVSGYTTAQIASALSSLPSMSIVTTNANMFGASGIYSNSDNHTLEVPGSLEYFNPLTGTTDWGGLAGFSMYGGVGRDPQYLKHGFQVSFDQSNGPSYMDENLFGDGYLPDGLILRQAFNDGWSWGGANAAFIHDSWIRDTLTALGTQNTPGIWVQLYVNGLYWGVYNAVADIDSDYSAYFFGGQKSDYDVYHYASDGFEVKTGTMAPWTAMFNVATHGNAAGTGTVSPTVLANPTAYALMAQYLNLPDFCDYIIVNYYAGNLDWDTHNYSALYRPGLGFVFQDWDGEMTFFSGWNSNPNVSITGDDNTGDPTQLFVQLLANPDFRQMFADHVYEDMTTALSSTNSAAMYQSLANTISTAVLDESARWGNLGELDGTWNQLGTPATWSAHINSELGSWFSTRTATMFSQFGAAVTFSPATGGSETYTMYPSFSPPVLSVNGTVENGGAFSVGAALTMAASTGTIYYTTDGSDPRVSSTNFTIASITLSGTTATVTIDNTATGFSNGEQISIGGATQTQYDNNFAIANVTVNSSAGTTTFTCTVSGSPTSPATPLAGQSLIAATAVGGAISATAHVYSGAITLSASETINARVLSGSTWSALNSSTFYLNLSSIVVTEVMYDPLPATAAEIAAGYVVSDTSNPNRDFQYIEIENVGTQTLPVGGLQISGGIDFTFPQYEGNVSSNPVLTLAPNHYLVVVADLSAFTIRYGAELQAKFGSNWQNLIVAGQFADHHLNDVSDEVELSSPNGGVIEDFTYQSSWYPQTQGGGYALMIQSPTEALSLCASSSGWEASGTYLGTPGFADPVTLPLPGAVVVNEVMSNPSAPSGYPPGDMIELYNTTSQSINIGGWFVGNNNSGMMGYEIAAGTAIAAGGYYVLTQAYNFGTLASDPGRLVPFTLDPAGDTVYLSNAYDFTVSSITGYPLVGGGTTATVVVNNTGYPLGAGLSNGEQINISGAAQTQYDGDFTIANVTVNSAAGTTSFTYVVSGSPASPATPIAGQSLVAGLAGGYREQQTVNSMPPGYSYGLYTKSDGATNFTLLQTPSFGTLVGTTYSGAANSIPYVSPLVTDEIMYDPSQPTAAEAAAGYVDNDFEYVELYNRSSSPVSLGNYYVAGGIGYTPGWLADGSLANQFTVSGITLDGTTATVTLNSTSTGFQNGDEIHIDGAAQTQYDGDFSIANMTVNSGAGTTTFTCTVNGSPASPATPLAGQSLTAGKDGELETLESGANATWLASGLASASYTVYAHLNLYDGDNNLLSDLDSQAQYTVTFGTTSTTVLVDQDQVPATLSVTSLTYNNTSGLVTAAANNALVNNNSLVAGSIVHISGATPSQYDGTFVVQSATSTSFTYALASGLNLASATGTITAGLNNVSDQPGDLHPERRGQRRAHPHHRRPSQRVDDRRRNGVGEQQPADHRAGHADLQFLLDPAPHGDPGPRCLCSPGEQLRGFRGTLQPHRQQQHPGAGRLFGPSQQRRRHGRHLPDRQSRRRRRGGAERLLALLPGRPRQLQQRSPLADPARQQRFGLAPRQHGRLWQ